MAMIEFDHVSKRFGEDFIAVDDLCLRVEDGEFMIFVGPSGCGKTTALRMLAGLELATSGDIRIGDHAVNHVDPQDRDIAMVFQNYALYPHKSVFENISFPLRMRNMAKPEIAARVAEVARMLSIEALLSRKPRDLSGGQRQRVAMARAIVRHPQAFLMDEPLSNLDAKLRIQMRVELVRLHRKLGVTTIYVTHDQTEAMTLGQRVTVLNGGRIQQVAAPRDLYAYPSNTFVAGFIGSPPMNFLRGRLTGTGISIGKIDIPLADEILRRIRPGPREVLVGIRPEGFTPIAGGEGQIAGEVEVIEELGAERYIYLRNTGLDVVEQSDRPDELAGSICVRLHDPLASGEGERLAFAVRHDLIRLFDEASGESRLQAPTSI